MCLCCLPFITCDFDRERWFLWGQWPSTPVVRIKLAHGAFEAGSLPSAHVPGDVPGAPWDPACPAKDSPFPSSRDNALTHNPLLCADWYTLHSWPCFLPKKGTLIPKHLQVWLQCHALCDAPAPVSSVPLTRLQPPLANASPRPSVPREPPAAHRPLGSLHRRPLGEPRAGAQNQERLGLRGWEARDLDGRLPWTPGRPPAMMSWLRPQALRADRGEIGARLSPHLPWPLGQTVTALISFVR